MASPRLLCRAGHSVFREALVGPNPTMLATQPTKILQTGALPVYHVSTWYAMCGSEAWTWICTWTWTVDVSRRLSDQCQDSAPTPAQSRHSLQPRILRTNQGTLASRVKVTCSAVLVCRLLEDGLRPRTFRLLRYSSGALTLTQLTLHCVTSLSTSRLSTWNRGCVHARKVDLLNVEVQQPPTAVA